MCLQNVAYFLQASLIVEIRLQTARKIDEIYNTGNQSISLSLTTYMDFPKTFLKL